MESCSIFEDPGQMPRLGTEARLRSDSRYAAFRGIIGCEQDLAPDSKKQIPDIPAISGSAGWDGTR